MVAAALLAAALAVPASAQLLDPEVAAQLAVLRAQLAAAKPIPPPALPAGTPPGMVRQFEGGWREAVRALQAPSCRDFFASRGAAWPRPLEEMTLTAYRFKELPVASTVGAETNGPGSVFINQSGVFTRAVTGWVTLDDRRWDLGGPDRVRALILLHELGHELGIFGMDALPGQQAENFAHSLDVMAHCLPAREVPAS